MHLVSHFGLITSPVSVQQKSVLVLKVLVLVSDTELLKCNNAVLLAVTRYKLDM